MNHFLSASRNVLFVGILISAPVVMHAQSSQDQQQADQRRAQEEAARQAAEQQRQQAEQQRQAMEAARQAEQQRQAAEAAHVAEQQRQAADAARQAEQQQRAQEESARQAEQQRQAEQANRQQEEQRRREAAQREQNAQRNEEARSRSGPPDTATATRPIIPRPLTGTSGTTAVARPTTATNSLRCSAVTSSMDCNSGAAVAAARPFGSSTAPTALRSVPRSPNPAMFQGELPHAETATVVARLELLRSKQPGLSAHPLPSGTLTGIGPRILLDASRGRSYTLNRGGKILAYSDSQRTVRLGFHETVRSLTTKNLKLQHGPQGRRRIVLHTAASTITRTGQHSGYVDAFTRRRGRIWRVRHRYHHGHGVVIYYSSVGYGGGGVDWYQPPVFYDDLFYSWLLADDDLFNYNGLDDTSTPDCLNELALLRSYPDLPAWLVRAVLRDLRQESCDDAAADGPDDESGWTSDQTTPLTDDLLSAIQQRVDEEISEEQQAAQGDAPDTAEFSPNDVYPVTYTLGVSVANSAASNGDADCFITAGDVLQLAAMPQAGGNTMTVVRTHKGDCARGTNVVVSFDDLLQMDSDFRQAVHTRIAFLHAHAGQFGLPAYTGPQTTTQAYSTEVSAVQQQSDAQALAAAGTEAQTAEKQAMAAMRAP